MASAEGVPPPDPSARHETNVFDCMSLSSCPMNQDEFHTDEKPRSLANDDIG